MKILLSNLIKMCEFEQNFDNRKGKVSFSNGVMSQNIVMRDN